MKPAGRLALPMPGSRLVSRGTPISSEASPSSAATRLRAEPHVALVAPSRLRAEPQALVAQPLRSPGAGTSRESAAELPAERLLVDEDPRSPSAMRVELAQLEEQVSDLRVKLSLAKAAVEWGGASPAARAIWRWRRRNDLRRAHAATRVALLSWEAELREEAASVSDAAATVSDELSTLKQRSTAMLSAMSSRLGSAEDRVLELVMLREEEQAAHKKERHAWQCERDKWDHRQSCWQHERQEWAAEKARLTSLVVSAQASAVEVVKAHRANTTAAQAAVAQEAETHVAVSHAAAAHAAAHAMLSARPAEQIQRVHDRRAAQREGRDDWAGRDDRVAAHYLEDDSDDHVDYDQADHGQFSYDQAEHGSRSSYEEHGGSASDADSDGELDLPRMGRQRTEGEVQRSQQAASIDSELREAQYRSLEKKRAELLLAAEALRHRPWERREEHRWGLPREERWGQRRGERREHRMEHRWEEGRERRREERRRHGREDKPEPSSIAALANGVSQAVCRASTQIESHGLIHTASSAHGDLSGAWSLPPPDATRCDGGSEGVRDDNALDAEPKAGKFGAENGPVRVGCANSATRTDPASKEQAVMSEVESPQILQGEGSCQESFSSSHAAQAEIEYHALSQTPSGLESKKDSSEEVSDESDVAPDEAADEAADEEESGQDVALGEGVVHEKDVSWGDDSKPGLRFTRSVAHGTPPAGKPRELTRGSSIVHPSVVRMPQSYSRSTVRSSEESPSQRGAVHFASARRGKAPKRSSGVQDYYGNGNSAILAQLSGSKDDRESLPWVPDRPHRSAVIASLENFVYRLASD